MAAELSTAKQDGTIGVISDTHGLLRPEVATHFKDVDMIVHAGDIGSRDVLTSLETIAPVIAVKGNMDGGVLSAFLNEAETFEFGSFTFHVLHDLFHLNTDPVATGIRMVISGHTHLPDLRSKDGVQYLNPGSAGPKRSNKPISVAKITCRNSRLQVVHFDLQT